MVALFALQRRLGRGPLVVALIFAGTLIPALGFFDVYPMRFSFVADHFQYLASAALLSLAAAAGYHLTARSGNWHRRMAPVAAASFLVILGSLTWSRAGAYQDAETLWRDTIRKNPGAWMARYNLANELRRNGRIEEAIFGHATTVAPRTALLVALAHRTYLLNANLGKKRVAEVKDRVERISSNEFAGDATKAAVDAAQAALFLVTMMPAMMPVIMN